MSYSAIIKEQAKAKVNLDLHILAKREDGYHELQSTVIFPDIYDELEFTYAEQIDLHIEGLFADVLANTTDLDNLVIKAAHSLKKAISDQSLGASIKLIKNLPIGSGIGGGSADAAATIRGLCKLWNVKLTDQQSMDLCRNLGADVPICYYSKPAIINGIGEKINFVQSTFRQSNIILINPLVSISTKDVFERFDRGIDPSFDYSFVHDIEGDSKLSANDLLKVACGFCPQVIKILQSLREFEDCDLFGMSGSGATCFALFQDQDALTQAKLKLRQKFPEYWIESGPVVIS